MDIRALRFHGPAIVQGARSGRTKSWEGAACVEAPLKPAISGSQVVISSLD